MADKKLKATIETVYNGKGVDQAEKGFAGVGKAASKTGGMTQKLTGQIGSLSKSVVGSVLGFASLGGAVLAVGNFINGSINDWVLYNEEVRKLGVATGTSTEDLSRMMQAADDLGISMDSMQMAMKLAAQNGIRPTIEGIAALSDRLIAIRSDTKRAEEMQKIFGKQWMEVAGFVLQGSEAIYKSTAAIEDGLVVTDKSAEGARDYAIAVDELRDAWTVFRNQLASDIAPGIVAALKSMTVAQEGNTKVAKYGNIVARDSDLLLQKWVDTADDVSSEMLAYRGVLGGAITSMNYLGEATANAIPPTLTLEEAIIRFGIAVENIPEPKTAKWGDLQREIKNVVSAIDELNTDLSGSIRKFEDQLTFKTNFGDVLTNQFEAAKQAIMDNAISTEEGMKALDGLFVAAEALKVKGGEITFQEAAQNIKDNLGLPLKDAVGWLQQLISKNGMTLNYKAILQLIYQSSGRTYSPYTPGNQGSGGPGTNNPPKPPGTNQGSGANGANFIVPPGYPNDSFSMGVQSGEHVMVTPAGQGVGGNTIFEIGDINVYETGNPQATAEMVVAILNKRMAMARNSGALAR